MSNPPIRIELFGAPVVHQGHASITRFRTHNVVVLLALLVLQRGRTFPREALAEALWPDGDPERQRARLRYELSLVREVLGGALTRIGNHAVALSETVSCDVWDFEQACTAADRAGREERGVYLLRAAQLPTTDFLPGFYEDALVAARDRLRTSHSRVITQLIAECTRRGDIATATVWSATLAERYPEHDPVVITAPSVVRPPSVVSAPTPKCAPLEISRPQPLPTRFFGRTSETTIIHQWHESKLSPILTITGPAGVGKTRLVSEALPDAVFVALADLHDSDRLYETIQTALRLDIKEGSSAEVTVISHLRSTPTLLILDNFEQLVEAGARHIASLITQAPQAQLLVTSRSRLEIAGERELALNPLPPVDARALFLERARAVRPDVADDEEVTAIVTLLDGLPLALELAAARTLALHAAQIRRQLANRFAFLVSRRRDIPERQRSLHAAFEWSIHLLSPPLLESFLRLCVFRGGFSEQAAEAVLASKHPTVDVLEALRSHSLIQVSFSANDVARYDLLVSLREFGLAHAPRPLLDDAHLCHAYFFKDLAQSSGTTSDTNTTALEEENLLAALGTLAERDSDSCAVLTLSLTGHWERTGRTAIARALLERCLTLLPEDSERSGSLLERLGSVQMNLPARAETFERGVIAYQASGDREGEARLRHAAASTIFAQGDVDGARDRFTACLTLRRELVEAGGEDAGLASTLHMLAVCTYRLDPEADVAPLLDEAEVRLRAANSLGLAFVLNTRRGHAWDRGDVTGAWHWGEAVEDVMLQHGRTAYASHNRAWLALPALAEGDSDKALACIQEAKWLVAGHEDPPNQVFLWHYGGLVAIHRGEYDEAFASLCYARELCAGLENKISMLNILRLLGTWHLVAREDARRAVRLWTAVDSLQAAPFARIPAPERQWQEAYERHAAQLLGSSINAERVAGLRLSLEAAITLATQR